MKKVTIASLSFCLIVWLLITADDQLRNGIRELYSLATSGAISFYGKPFHLFGDYYYLIITGGLFAIHIFEGLQSGWQRSLKTIGIFLILWVTCLSICTTLLAKLRIISCTMCDDGQLQLHANDISYELLISSSVIMASLPFIFRVIIEQYRKIRNANGRVSA